MKTTYGVNVALTNGDVFCREYRFFDEAHRAYYRMTRNPLCIACELVNLVDETIVEYVADDVRAVRAMQDDQDAEELF